MRLPFLSLWLSRCRRESRRRRRLSRAPDLATFRIAPGDDGQHHDEGPTKVEQERLHSSSLSTQHEHLLRLSRASRYLTSPRKLGWSRTKEAGCENARSSTPVLHSRTWSYDDTSQDLPLPCTSEEDPRPEPLLMLEGDVMCVIDGVSRTRYVMEASSSMAIEETHELATGKKRYALTRAAATSVDSDESTASIANYAFPSLDPLVQIEIQEILRSTFSNVGSTNVDCTGGSTWESSVAMALHFASHPDELTGLVLELGSGVGVGGMLLLAVQHGLCGATNMESLTLTDGNDEVVRLCKENLQRATSSMVARVPIRVRCLNWGDGAELDRIAAASKFDTILASDCVYRRGDIPALAGAMARLLKDDDHNCASQGTGRSSRIHIFSPLNRAALPDFIDALKGVGMHVVQESIIVQRSRLGRRAEESSTNASTFVHVAASRGREPPTASMCDVD